MNKDLEILKTQYFELCRSFLTALQNNRPSEELELIRQQIKEVTAKMQWLSSSAPAAGESQ
jgi:hypothetical protein